MYALAFPPALKGEILSRAYARDPVLTPIEISPRLRAEIWHEV
jgi:hypothetical protein